MKLIIKNIDNESKATLDSMWLNLQHYIDQILINTNDDKNKEYYNIQLHEFKVVLLSLSDEEFDSLPYDYKQIQNR